MNVKDLIEELQKLPQESIVKFGHEYDCVEFYCRDIESITISEDLIVLSDRTIESVRRWLYLDD